MPDCGARTEDELVRRSEWPAAAPESHRDAATAIRNRIPQVIAAYRGRLEGVDSVLIVGPEPWQSVSRQASAIIEESLETLEEGRAPDTDDAVEYTRLLGVNRALQKIPVSESIRAAELLWSALQPVVNAAAASAAADQRVLISQRINTAFRAAVSLRLYAGAQGHEGARDRIVAMTTSISRTSAAATTEDGSGSPAPVEDLTAREQQILDAVACALTNQQIAGRLGISEGTVKRHMHNIFNKLGATSRMDAVQKGAKRG